MAKTTATKKKTYSLAEKPAINDDSIVTTPYFAKTARARKNQP